MDDIDNFSSVVSSDPERSDSGFQENTNAFATISLLDLHDFKSIFGDVDTEEDKSVELHSAEFKEPNNKDLQTSIDEHRKYVDKLDSQRASLWFGGQQLLELATVAVDKNDMQPETSFVINTGRRMFHAVRELKNFEFSPEQQNLVGRTEKFADFVEDRVIGSKSHLTTDHLNQAIDDIHFAQEFSAIMKQASSLFVEQLVTSMEEEPFLKPYIHVKISKAGVEVYCNLPIEFRLISAVFPVVPLKMFCKFEDLSDKMKAYVERHRSESNEDNAEEASTLTVVDFELD